MVLCPRTTLAFSVGNHVQCTTGLNVRSTPSTSGSLVTTEASGSQGSISSGPQSGSGYTWWYINWANGYSGWSVQDYLQLVPPPSATTTSATSVTATSAQLNGNINGNGLVGTVYFQYGTTTSYGYTTPSGDMGPTAGSGSYSVSSLAPNTIYHFRVVASSSAGTTYGGDLTFTTASLPAPTAQTVAATSITATSAQLNGNINGNGIWGTVYWQYGTTTSYGYTTPSGDMGPTAGSGSYSVSSLAPNTIYHFRVAASSSAGTTYGGDLTFQTLQVSTQIPTVQTLNASSVTATSATLNGQILSDGGSTILERRIEWAKFTGNWGTGTSGVDYGFFSDATTAFNVSGNNFSLFLSGFAPNTSYKYRVWARNSNGWSDVSLVNTVIFNTLTQAAASLSVNVPNGGTTWTAGTAQTISWTVNGTPNPPVSYFALNYSLDSGSTWHTTTFYASGSAASGSWSIPSTAISSSARVQIIAVNSSGVAMFWNQSGSDFTISAPGQNPVANPTADNHAPQSGQSVNFTSNNSYDPASGCSINSYSWNFGDRSGNSTAANPSHTFFSPAGSSQYYLVTLSVSDTCGRSGASSFYIYVTGQALGNNPQQSFSKDPVNLATGNYTYNHSDLFIAGRGLPFEFKRFYNSKAPPSATQPLGFGWTHSYNIFASINASNSVVIAYGDGHQETYAPNGTGGYISEPGIYNVLTTSGGIYTLTTKDQQQYNFNSAGQLTSIVDKNNNTVALAYTGNNLTTITDIVGRVISFAYNANNCLTNITDPLGRTVRFAYDATTNLTGVADLRGNLTQFGYDSFHQITNAVDPRGNTFVSMQYDTLKRVVLSQLDALNNTSAFSYDFVNGITIVTDANGNMSTNHYDQFLRVTEIDDNLGQSQRFFYDTNNNRIQVIDKNGNSTSYAYDGNGNVISKTDPIPNATTISYDAKNNPTDRLDAQNELTLFSYDAKGNLTNTVNSLGKTNTYQYDASGEAVVMTDANGNSTTNTYDSLGNLIQTQDALDGTNTFAYDAVGRKLKQVDALGRTNLFIYDNADNLTATVNALGKTNYFGFDGNNNRVSATDFRSNTTSNIYDPKDRLIITRDPLGGSTTNDYDALDRKIRVWDAMGGVTRYGYDADGNLVAVTNATGAVWLYSYDGNGNRTNSVDALGNSTTNVFDSLNRLVSTWDPLGHTTVSVYDGLGRRIQSVDALIRTNVFAYDSMGRLTNFTDTAGGTVTNTYDNVGNRLFSTDPNGHTRTNVFDALNRLVNTIDPVGGVTQLGYDAVDNLVSRKDPNGNTTSYQYDANNRRTKIIYPTGIPVNFGYDHNGNRTNMTDSLGTTSYVYDALNRLTSVIDCFGETVSYGYDKNGNRTYITYPGGKTVRYSYDAMNRLRTVTDWLDNTTTYNYDAAGKLTNSVNPNGTAAVYQYDPANRLVALTNTINASVISSYQYTLDAVGNHSQVNQTEQLPTIPVVGQSTYAYDNDGKQTTLDGQQQGFDANGNMISVNPTNLLAYDYENRLVQTAFEGTTNTYQYDGAGNRMSAKRGEVVTRYLLDRNSPLAQVLAEADSNGNVIYYYIYGLGLVSRIDAGGNSQYYHYDSRGSAIAMTDSSGQISEAYSYDPFGQPINGHYSDNRVRCLGRHGVMDEENGLLYIRARYYSPKRGRFITKDPTTGNDGDSQSMNRYNYALNNPVVNIDPSGLAALYVGGSGGIGGFLGYVGLAASGGVTTAFDLNAIIPMTIIGLKPGPLSNSDADYVLQHSAAYYTVSGELQGGVGGEAGPGVTGTIGIDWKDNATDLGGTTFYFGGSAKAIVGIAINYSPSGYLEADLNASPAAKIEGHVGYSCFAPTTLSLPNAVKYCAQNTPIISEILDAHKKVGNNISGGGSW